MFIQTYRILRCIGLENESKCAMGKYKNG